MKMCDAFSRNGYDVTLLASMLYGDHDVNIFQYYGVKNKFKVVRKRTAHFKGSTFLLSLRYFPLLKKIAASAEETLFYGRDVITLCFLTKRGKKVIYETHEMPMKLLRKRAEQQLIKSTNLEMIIFISNELRKSYLDRYGKVIAGKEMIIAPDASDEHPDFTQMVALSGRFDFNCCYIGGIYEGRGIGLILEVAKRLPDVGFHLFGSKAIEVDNFNEQSPANVYYYEYVSPSQIYKVRNTADVLLMPYQKKVSVAQSVSDTSRWMSPMKLFEYMAAKKPIVSSNHKVLREILKHRYNALLCEPDNAGQWADAITLLRNDKILYENISTNAYNDLINKYTWEKRVKSILFDNLK
jgi:glycosyltransferase involved in cell wall biosynthesis